MPFPLDNLAVSIWENVGERGQFGSDSNHEGRCTTCIQTYRILHRCSAGLWILLFVASFLTTADADTTFRPSTPLITSCQVIFTADTTDDIFSDACTTITFPCMGAMGYQRVDPTDCSYYFECSEKRVFRCPCGSGTQLDARTGSCVDPFYANCTCPDGRQPPTTPTIPPTSGSPAASQVPLIAGVVAALLIMVILIIVVVLLVRKKRQNAAQRMEPATIGKKESVKAGHYEDIDEIKRGDYPNVYDNGPVIGGINIYDNHGFSRGDYARRGTTNTLQNDPDMPTTKAPALPKGHPSLTSLNPPTRKYVQNEDEPEYMESI